jgi:hypothetical protein
MKSEAVSSPAKVDVSVFHNGAETMPIVRTHLSGEGGGGRYYSELNNSRPS